MFCTTCGRELAPKVRFCDNCGAVIDTQATGSLDLSGVVSRGDQIPEIEFVGFWIRLAAWTIDAIPFFLASALLGPFIFPAWLAYRITLIVMKGQTIGKMLCKVQVVNSQGDKPNIGQAFVRELVSPLTLFLANLWVSMDPHRRGWHDHAADTYVLRRQAIEIPTQTLELALREEIIRREEQRRQEYIRRQDQRERKRELDDIRRKERSLQSSGGENVQSIQVGNFNVGEVLDQILRWAPMFPQVSSQLTGGRVSREQATLIVEILENMKRSSNSDGTLNAAFWLNYSVMQLSFVNKMSSGTLSNQDIAVYLVYNFLVSHRLSNT